MLTANAKIAAIPNLCDTDSDIMEKAEFAPWYNKLLKSSRVIALGMDFSLTSETFGKSAKYKSSRYFRKFSMIVFPLDVRIDSG